MKNHASSLRFPPPIWHDVPVLQDRPTSYHRSGDKHLNKDRDVDMPVPYANPAERLSGVELGNGWTVGNKLPTGRRGGGTGGFFSVSYEVRNGNKQAFLKAFDILKPIQDAVAKGRLFTTVLLEQLQAFEFETQLHTLCANRKMRRIVKILEHGQASVTPVQGEQISTVPYMIMELADGGDVRSYIQQSENIDFSIRLYYLRDVASGIVQLHIAQIAHQDLKPSNVMIFSEAGAKIGDLGRASKQNVASLHDQFGIAGDKAYAPPEQIYRHPLNDWFDRRQRCDLYQFGSLICFVFFGTSLNTILRTRLPYELTPIEWGGANSSYDQALPFLKQVFNEALLEWEAQLPTWLSVSLIEIIRQCGTPSYAERGSKKTIKMSTPNLGMDRFVSELDRLAFKSVVEARRLSARAVSVQGV